MFMYIKFTYIKYEVTKPLVLKLKSQKIRQYMSKTKLRIQQQN